VTDFSQDERRVLAPGAPEDWVIALATALIAFVLLGILPRLFW
jgi:hypothetical protein